MENAERKIHVSLEMNGVIKFKTKE